MFLNAPVGTLRWIMEPPLLGCESLCNYHLERYAAQNASALCFRPLFKIKINYLDYQEKSQEIQIWCKRQSNGLCFVSHFIHTLGFPSSSPSFACIVQLKIRGGHYSLRGTECNVYYCRLSLLEPPMPRISLLPWEPWEPTLVVV